MADYGGAISLSQGRDLSHTSDEDEDSDISPRSLPTLSCGVVGGGGSSSSSLKPRKSPAGGDEIGGLEMSKKPRGRPPGSKNKPKPPVVITKDYSDLSLKPVVLEISAGSDVVESLMQFARRRRVGITVLSGTGSVSNVTLRHPVSHAPALSLHGPFGLLSLSGSFAAASSSSSRNIPSSSSPSPSPSPSSPPSSSSSAAALSCCSSFGICLAGAQGQVFGGIVGGKVIAASLVVVVAATFLSPGFYRLPGGDQADHDHDHQVEEAKPCIRSITGGAVSVAGNEGGSCGGDRVGSSTAMSMSVFNVSSPNPISCQISPDVMPWGPTSRPPPY